MSEKGKALVLAFQRRYPPPQPTYERCVSDAWRAVDKVRLKERS